MHRRAPRGTDHQQGMDARQHPGATPRCLLDHSLPLRTACPSGLQGPQRVLSHSTASPSRLRPPWAHLAPAAHCRPLYAPARAIPVSSLEQKFYYPLAVPLTSSGPPPSRWSRDCGMVAPVWQPSPSWQGASCPGQWLPLPCLGAQATSLLARLGVAPVWSPLPRRRLGAQSRACGEVAPVWQPSPSRSAPSSSTVPAVVPVTRHRSPVTCRSRGRVFRF